jgi:hypothetical protein
VPVLGFCLRNPGASLAGVDAPDHADVTQYFQHSVHGGQSESGALAPREFQNLGRLECTAGFFYCRKNRRPLSGYSEAVRMQFFDRALYVHNPSSPRRTYHTHAAAENVSRLGPNETWS